VEKQGAEVKTVGFDAQVFDRGLLNGMKREIGVSQMIIPRAIVFL
jgi:hypothetical protein